MNTSSVNYQEVDISFAALIKSAFDVWQECSRGREDVDPSAIEQLVNDCLRQFINAVGIQLSDVESRLKELETEYEQGLYSNPGPGYF